MTMKISMTIWGAGAFAAVVGSSSDSQAAKFAFTDANPVGICVNASGTGSVAHDWEGELNASTTETLTLDCSPPFIYNGLPITRAGVFYVDNSTTQEVVCNMRVVHWWGATLYTGPQKSSSGTESDDHAWAIYPPLTTVGQAYVSCQIPKAGAGTRSGLTYVWVSGTEG